MTLLFLLLYNLFTHSCNAQLIHACSLSIIYQNSQKVLCSIIQVQCLKWLTVFISLWKYLFSYTSVPFETKMENSQASIQDYQTTYDCHQRDFQVNLPVLTPSCIPLHGSSLVFICEGTTALSLRLGVRDHCLQLPVTHLSISRKSTSLRLHLWPAP